MEVKNLKTIERIFEAYRACRIEQQPHVRLVVPTGKFDGFKRQVLGTWFDGDNPILVRHNLMSDEEHTVATFSSESSKDIETVCEMLPNGGDYWFDYLQGK